MRSRLAGGGWHLAVAIATAAAGCKHAPPAGPPPEAAALLEQVRKGHKEPQTLTCEAKAFVDAPQNGGRYALQIAVRRPASLRIAALDPLGNPAALLVADGGRFALLDLRSNVFYRGPSTPENLSRLIPAPLRDEELVSLLLGAMPELPGARPVAVTRAGDGWVLVLEAPSGMTQEVSVSPGLRLDHIRRFAGGNLWWAVTLDEFDDASGQEMPRLLHFSVPEEKTEVELRLKDRLWGKPPPPGAFQLGVPPGMKVVEVD